MSAYMVEAWIANQPGRGAVIQRYLPMWKLRDLVSTSTLYLPSLDDQDDGEEGRWPSGIEQLMFDQSVDSERLKDALEAERHRTYANCWTMRLEVMDALWVAYGAEDGAVVCTTVDALEAALGDAEEDLAMGGVTYTDRIDGDWPVAIPG